MEYHPLNKIVNCPSCKEKQTKIIRVNKNGAYTHNTCLICENLNCDLQINLAEVSTWERTPN